MLKEITDENIEALSKNIAVVLFTSPWCSGCKKVESFLKELSASHPEIVFGELDISSNTATPARLGVLSLPTIVAFKDGSEYERIAGEPSRHEIEHLIRDLT